MGAIFHDNTLDDPQGRSKGMAVSVGSDVLAVDLVSFRRVFSTVLKHVPRSLSD